MDKINWYRCERKVDPSKIAQTSQLLGIKFPREFYNLLMECDAGIPNNTNFEYYDEFHKRKIVQSMGGFLGIIDEDYNLLKIHKHPPEFFPEGLIAFAETGNGDFVCFDYRQGKDNLDPPIVYWSHGADIGKDVSFIAHNFEEFIGMLTESED